MVVFNVYMIARFGDIAGYEIGCVAGFAKKGDHAQCVLVLLSPLVLI